MKKFELVITGELKETFKQGKKRYPKHLMTEKTIEFPTDYETLMDVCEAVEFGQRFVSYEFRINHVYLKEIFFSYNVNEDTDVFGEMLEDMNDLVERVTNLNEEQEYILEWLFDDYDLEQALRCVENGNAWLHENITMGEVAEELVNDCYGVPEFLQRFINWDDLGEEMERFDNRYITCSRGVIEYEI